MNNPQLFNAALVGAASGMATSGGAPTQTNQLQYARIATTSQAFATALDSAILPILNGPTQAQIEIMTELCKAYFTGRVASSTSPLSYARPARVIYAEWIAITTQLSTLGLAATRIVASVCGLIGDGGALILSNNNGFGAVGIGATNSEKVASGQFRLYLTAQGNFAVGTQVIVGTYSLSTTSFPLLKSRVFYAVDSAGDHNIRVETQVDSGGGFADDDQPFFVFVMSPLQ